MIVVITKSYSVPERENNIEMVNDVFAKQKRYSKNLRNIIPVVASTFVLNDSAYAAPEGITELIDATNDLMPEGVKASEKDIDEYKLYRKRAMVHGVTGISNTAAVVVGAVPVPFPDALILTPMEVATVNSIARIYGIKKNEESKQFFNSIIEVGTVSAAAKAAINALKAIPGINLGASALNAIIAGSIVVVLGESTIYVFEQVYLGEKSLADIDWLNKVMESKLSSQFIEKVKIIIEKVNHDTDKDTIGQIIIDVFKGDSSVSDS